MYITLILHSFQKRDVHVLQTYAYDKTVNRATVEKLLDEAFPKCQCSVAQDVQDQSSDIPSESSTQSSITFSTPAPCKGHEVTIPIDELTRSLDMSEESIFTLLCYLELQNDLKLMGTRKDTCILTWNGGQAKLRRLERKYPIIAAAIEFNRNDG